MRTRPWKTLRKSHRAFVILERESTEPSQEESPPGIAKGLMVTLLSPFSGRKYASLTSMLGWCLLSQEACCGGNAICFCLLWSLQTALFSGWMTATPITGKTRWHLPRLVAECFRRHRPHSVFMLMILIIVILSPRQMAAPGSTTLSLTHQNFRYSNKAWHSNRWKAIKASRMKGEALMETSKT